MPYFVYIMSNQPYGTLYIGMTSDLIKRVYEHKHHLVEGFTDRYDLNMLVHYEETCDVHAALQREKNLKHWIRDWKLELITKNNPQWRDLSLEWPEFSDWMDPRVKPEDDKVR